METEFDKFVSDLPGSEKEFDMTKDLAGDPQEPVQVVEQKIDEDQLPFAKNPKVQKFIEKQVKKQLEQYQQPKVEYVEKTVKDTDTPAEWLAMYGDTEDSKKAWKFNEKILNDFKTQAKQEALEDLRSEQSRAASAVKEFESLIETNLEDLEDEYGIDLTSKSAAPKRAEFLDLVQRLSPKDSEGNVTSYADFGEVYQIFQLKQSSNPTLAKQKTLAARTMTKSNDTPIPKQGYEAGMGAEGVRRALGLD